MIAVPMRVTVSGTELPAIVSTSSVQLPADVSTSSVQLPADVSISNVQIHANVGTSNAEIPAEIGVAFVKGTGRPYTERYEATPTNEVQVFHTKGLTMNKNFIVNPIPSNYGFVTYNGSTITIT